jgi:hypothetical protein
MYFYQYRTKDLELEELNPKNSIVCHFKKIPKNRLWPGLAADFFVRDRTPVN